MEVATNRKLAQFHRLTTAMCSLSTSKEIWTPHAHTRYKLSAAVILSPRMAIEVMKTHDPTIVQRPERFAPKVVTYDGTNIAFSPCGDYWRKGNVCSIICTLELLIAKMVQYSCLRKRGL